MTRPIQNYHEPDQIANQHDLGWFGLGSWLINLIPWLGSPKAKPRFQWSFFIKTIGFIGKLPCNKTNR